METSKLSDDELIKLYQEEQNKSLQGMSDDELMAVYNSEKTNASQGRQEAIKNVDQAASTVNEFLPGKATQKAIDGILPEGIAQYTRPVTEVADEALKQYGNALYGAVRGVPVAGAYVDEAAAAAGALFNGDYDNNLEHMRAIDDVSERDYGAANTYGKLAGGLSAGYGLGTKVITKGAPLLVNAGKSALAAATVGGAHEFGEGEGFKNRMDRGKDGAVFGGVIGGVLPIAGASVSKVAAPLVNKFVGNNLAQFGQSSDEAADAILASRLGAKGIDDAAADLARGKRSARFHSNSHAELPEAIADTSDESQRLLGSLYRRGQGGLGDEIRDGLKLRQHGANDPLSRIESMGPNGQYKNIMGAVERSLGIKGQKGSFQKTKDILNKQQSEGNQLYRTAFNKSDEFNINDELMETYSYSLTQRGKIGKSLRKAHKYFAGDKNTTQVKTLKEFDDAKKALDDDIMRAKGNQKRELVSFKNRLLGRVHDFDANGKPTKNLDYQKARDVWGSQAQSKEAIDLGKNALKPDIDDIVDQFKALSPGDKVLFRVGLRDAFKKTLRTKTPGNDISKLFSQNRIRELMAEVIPQSKKAGDVFGDKAARFGEFVRRQGRLNETNQKVLGGSPTAKNTADDKAMDGDIFNQALGATRSTSIIANTLGVLGDFIAKKAAIRAPVARRMAKILMEQDPRQQQVILKRLKAKLGNNRYEKFITEWDQTMAGLGITAAGLEKE